ncbi:MAG: response regulator [Chloroflexi bacterium]|nr:response regulator [Chloroflexota bacterium]
MPAAEPSSRKIRVLVVDDIIETRENVRKLLYFEDDIEIVGTASNGREGVELVAKLLPDIVLMDINMPGMDGIAASEAIAAQNVNAQVIMMSVQGEADYLRRSMLAGAREFLIKPFSGEELATSIRRVYQLSAARRAAAPIAPQPTSASAPSPPPPPRGGQVIAIFGSKGGCGASTLAVNLAVALREDTKERVAIMDANFEFGDIGVLLNLPNNRTIADLAGPKLEIDEEIVNASMAGHGSGIKALLAPPRPEMAELITAEHCKTIIEILPKMFDYVIVDLWRSFQEQTVTLLDAANQILLVSTSDIPAIKNAKLFFELTDALKYPPEKTCFILNKEDGRSGIGPRDIEASIKHPVRLTLPKDERTTLLALNRGTPFFMIQRKVPLSQAVLLLARSLQHQETRQASVPASAAPPQPPQKTGWLRRK